MAYALYVPGQPLSGLIACFWYWEGAPRTAAKDRLMPTGEASVIVNLRDDPLRVYDADDLECGETYGLAMLSGARTTPFVIPNEQQDRVFGIQFRAAGAFPFFRAPADEMENRGVELSDLWGGGAGELRERLLEAGSAAAMFRAAEAVLMERAARPFDPNPAVSFALRSFCSGEAGTVAEVTGRVGLSARRFIEIFRERVGLTPKAFQRVRRFQQVLRSIHGAREVDWAQVALASGYYDQAHFIHDFRGFSGLTPGEYSRDKTEHLNHVPVRE